VKEITMGDQIKPDKPVGPERMVALADGVFAIVMTLLVFELGVPLASGSHADSNIGRLLLTLWPKFAIYGLSFLILGVFWLMHHAVFVAVLSFDYTLAWINILVLMFVGLIPFATLLIGVYGITTITALAYGINVFLVQGLCWSLWLYATGNLRLVSHDIDPGLVRGGRLMGVFYCLLILAGIAFAFVQPAVSFFVYAFIIVAFILSTALGRWELVMTWAPRRKREVSRS
jgi:uncharacterized membrane protein